MVNGLESVRLMFPSEIVINDSVSGEQYVDIIPLFTSSNRSTTMEEFFNLNPDPEANPAFRQLSESGKVLGALAEISHSETGTLSQLILISDSKFIADDGGGAAPENHIFIMNSVDFLVGDRDLIALRSREITSRPLEEVSDGAKRTWKWVNIITPSFLIIGFGLIRIRSQKKRSNVLEELYG